MPLAWVAGVQWDRAKLERLKVYHALMVEDGRVWYQFEGRDYLVRYAVYLLEYLDAVLAK